MTDTPPLPPRSRRRGQQGFSLVELLVVVVVLGVLSGIVVLAVAQFRGDAEGAACKADVVTVSAAADAYRAVTGAYPTSMAQLVAAKYLRSAPATGAYTFDATYRITVREPECPDAVGASAAAFRRVVGRDGRCLDLANTSGAWETPVQLGTCDRRVSQRWAAPASWPGTVTVLGKCLDVRFSGTGNSTPIWLYGCNGTGAQQWVLGADLTLRNPQSGRCLDAGSSGSAGTQLYLWDCQGGANQRWVFQVSP